MLSEEYFTKQVFSESIAKYKVVKRGAFAYNPARVNIGSLGRNEYDFEGCVSPVYVVFECKDGYANYFDLYRGFDNKLLQDFKDEMLATIGLDSELQQQDTVLKNIAPPNLDIKWFNTQWGLDCTNINDLVTKGEELFNKEWNDIKELLLNKEFHQ